MRPEYAHSLVIAAATSVPIATSFSGDGFRVARPWGLALLAAVALAAWWLVERGRQGRAALAFSRGADARAASAAAGFWGRAAGLPGALRLVTLALLALAIARPQTFRPTEEIETEGIDIMIVLDLSESMKETDLSPDRIGAARRVIADFIERRRDDRIGLVVFGREAFTYAPLTLDYGVLKSLVREVKIGYVDGKGTAIGNALGVALARLRASDAKSKVVVLLTDGDNNAGNLAPQEAASIAQKMGVRVFTVLAGDHDNKKGALGVRGLPRRPHHPVNPRLLEDIAGQTGGTAYLATDSRALARNFHAILEDLDRSKRRDVGVIYGEAFPRFAWPALILLLAETALRLTRLRRLP